ncbi:Oidioi.mRNA.OKI2018_I69.chr1.g602.t1.cds [Oikopleura dioica]|uniref:Oidioi.mRNA.OKI2018_I69.chr1.g602.t1.cds n=1 Tax=Oikopleura dioica TaxID=34765 RepID=A0ABN7SM20_OIKDI|nr:Oidioi.mRNA.OKI2018_I69.chr1.g602.t1.cds [Oikopleura dioica]
MAVTKRAKSINPGKEIQQPTPSVAQTEATKDDESEESQKTARKMNAFNTAALNSALVVGNFIMLKNEIEKYTFCGRICDHDLSGEECRATLASQQRTVYYCEDYPMLLKMSLAALSIVLQVVYGFIDIVLIVEKQEDEKDGLETEEVLEKMEKRVWITFIAGVLGLLISIVNYVIAAFE